MICGGAAIFNELRHVGIYFPLKRDQWHRHLYIFVMNLSILNLGADGGIDINACRPRR
jgi:hypothetical protein